MALKRKSVHVQPSFGVHHQRQLVFTMTAIRCSPWARIRNGRITALADVFDALCSKRCYKEAWTDENIFELIKSQKGKHFDPGLVELFFAHLSQFLEIREKFPDDSLQAWQAKN